MGWGDWDIPSHVGCQSRSLLTVGSSRTAEFVSVCHGKLELSNSRYSVGARSHQACAGVTSARIGQVWVHIPALLSYISHQDPGVNHLNSVSFIFLI